MDKRRYGKTLSACLAGVFNQAVITNVTALLFVPLADLYGFTFAQLGLLTAINFAAQMLADVFLMLFIGRFSHKKLAVFAAAVSCAGLLFYGGVPFIFSGGALYGGIAGATAVFAFAGGMLEVVLNAVADRLPEGTPVTICFLHTAYAWAQAGLALLLFGCIALFGTESWHYAMFVLALVPLSAIALLSGADMPEEENPVKKEHSFFTEGSGLPPRGKGGFGAFYVFALAAIFFGYGSEVCMNQWVSTLFSETAGGGGYVGEFFGAAAFAVCLGLGGLFYVRLGSRKKASRSALFFSALAVFVCFLGAGGLGGGASFAFAAACGLFVGWLSPGVMTVASENLPGGGRMLASLAVASDLGAAALPALAGALSGEAGLRSSFFLLSAAPLVCAVAPFAMRKCRRSAARSLFFE